MSKFGQIRIIFGHYLAKFGYEIFFGRAWSKDKKVFGVSFEGYFIKKNELLDLAITKNEQKLADCQVQ